MNAPRVLVIEDDPDILEILDYNLSNEGYEVATETDAPHRRSHPR